MIINYYALSIGLETIPWDDIEIECHVDTVIGADINLTLLLDLVSHQHTIIGMSVMLKLVHGLSLSLVGHS